MMKESRKVYGWLARDRNAAVECSSVSAGGMGGENHCCNLLWQSSLPLLFSPRFFCLSKASFSGRKIFYDLRLDLRFVCYNCCEKEMAFHNEMRVNISTVRKISRPWVGRINSMHRAYLGE